MSGRLSVIVMKVVPMTLFIAVLGAAMASSLLVSAGPSGDRYMASVPSEKLSVTPNAQGHSHFRHTMKLSGPLEIAVQASNPRPAAGQSFLLVGSVRATQNLRDVRVRWELPSGISAVSGDVETRVDDWRAGESRDFTLEVRQTADANLQIHLSAQSGSTEHPFSEVAQYNTWYEQTLIEEKKALLKRSEAYSRARRKVFQ